jgi:hypothetical protein
MPKVTVYKVRHFDINTNEARIIPRLVTREGAKTMGDGFEIIEGMGVEIDTSQLEHGEEYTPRGFTP